MKWDSSLALFLCLGGVGKQTGSLACYLRPREQRLTLTGLVVVNLASRGARGC